MTVTLNLKDVRIFDYIEDDEGKRKAVLNKKETAIAQAKQELIKQGFQDWVWADPERREKLTRLYNEKFNSVRPREYDGSHIIFSGMNPEIILREHQRNAVAHILYGGNTLLAHAVGAGKTFEMVAASQELKRLGLCNKSLFVVPNHLTEQWAAEYLQLYPSANILVATKKDFETKNRKRFCGRIATGDYDAVIIGHSQFEKIPMSIERQRAILEQQIEELTNGIAELKENRGERFSIKQLERSKKSVTQKLAKLNDQSRKDDVVTFEELGVDRLFIDESHYYKNLFLYTKMRNVGGIAQTEAQKSSDLFMKCRYLDEITGGRGTVFATGTPISIVPKGYTKPIRLKNLGEDYTEEAIKRRLMENQRVRIVPFAKQTVVIRQYRLPTREQKIKKVGGLYGLYLHYCYKLGYLPKYKKQNTKRLHYLLKEDLLKLDKITAETRLLGREHIFTDEQLFSYKASLNGQIETLIDDRTHLRKISRTKMSDDELSKVKGQIVSISGKIRELRKEVWLCDDIAERSKVMEQNLETIRAEEEKQERKEQNRYDKRR